MKFKLPVLFVFLVSSIEGQPQGFGERELATKIEEVTVFLNGAQIFEVGNTSIPKGNTIFTIKNLSPYLDEKSIQVKTEGECTILSVNHKVNYLNEIKKGGKLDSIRNKQEQLEKAIAYDQAKLEVLKEKQSVLNENKKLGGQATTVTLRVLKQALDFYENEISKIKETEIKIKSAVEENKKKVEQLGKQIKELADSKQLPTSEIEIRVSSEKNITAKFSLSYLVANAGWYPKYDVRVENIKSPLELTYKAEVFQNTGVDWANVKLRFSNGDPNQSGAIPNLHPFFLNYERFTVYDKAVNGFTQGLIRSVKGKVVDESGEPLPGVNVLVKGTTIGTVTDAGGNYSLTLPNNAQQLVFSFIGYTSYEETITKPEISVVLKTDIQSLQEVVVVGYGSQADDALQGKAAGVRIRGASSLKKFASPLLTNVIENQTTVEIEVATPYTIKSSGEKLQVDLRRHEIDALYEYYSIPKLDKDAFLMARIINWDQYNLLEGEANLYFEDAFVGRSILDAKALKDTLEISLGRDKNIVVGREKVEQFSKRRSIAGNIIETRGFKIIASNKKSLAIKLTIFDQVPVSVASDISVNSLELSNGKLEEKTGKVIWELSIEPQQQKELSLQYEVKYPKRERVILE